MMLTYIIVKFDTDKLPPILNALETMNGGQKLVLEVAVRLPRSYLHMRAYADWSYSNIWVRMSSGRLLWTVIYFSFDV